MLSLDSLTPKIYAKTPRLFILHISLRSHGQFLVSWLITRFRNRVPGCRNRVTRIRLYYMFFFLTFMLVELILATCTECGRPTFSSYRMWQWLRLGFLLVFLRGYSKHCLSTER